MGWAASSQGTGERSRTELGEPSWHRRARRTRQQDRILVAVSKASCRLASHHSSDMSDGAFKKTSRPWVCCDRCRGGSWVFLDLGIARCRFCRSPFPKGHKVGSEGGASPQVSRPVGKGGSSDVQAAFQLLLGSDKCQTYKDALLGMSKEVCPPQPKKPGAEITAASQRVCRAVRDRDAARTKLSKVPVLMERMLEELGKLRDTVPRLQSDLEAAETELAVASAENDRVLQQARVPEIRVQIPEGMDEEAKGLVLDIKAQIESLSQQLAMLCSTGKRQQQQQQQSDTSDDVGSQPSAGRWSRAASTSQGRGPETSGEAPDAGMPVDEVSKRKRVSFDPYADGSGDLSMYGAQADVVSVPDDDDEDEWIPPTLFSHAPGPDDPDPLSDAIFGDDGGSSEAQSSRGC